MSNQLKEEKSILKRHLHVKLGTILHMAAILDTSRKLLRIKVIPDLHQTYS